MKCNSASFESDRPQIKVLSQEKIEKIHESYVDNGTIAASRNVRNEISQRKKPVAKSKNE